MKIRITSAKEFPLAWYAKYIGQAFTVIREANGDRGYKVAHHEQGDELATGYYVSKSDCTVIGEEGSAITLLPDESLGGTLREYREVKRKACVGERIKIVNNGAGHGLAIGHITVADSEDGAEDWALYHVEERENPDYVVLEPSDILRIGTERFRMVDRKATVGERVIVTKVRAGYGIFSAGNVGIAQDEPGLFDFNGQGNVNYNADDGVWYVGPYNGNSEYRVLEPLTSAKPTPLSELSLADQYAENITVLTRKIAELEEHVNALEVRILALETDSAPAIVKVAEGYVGKSERAALPSYVKNIRDEIVERAKADVKWLEASYGGRVCGSGVSFWPDACAKGGYAPVHNVDYVVNAQKRTVVALIRYKSGELCYRGIAKCAPGDVFNAHLGRAIALRRALGLEVPAEYLTCPMPEEVRVGDVIAWRHALDEVYTVGECEGKRVFILDGEEFPDSYGPLKHGQYVDILDDSREEDGGISASPSALKGAA